MPADKEKIPLQLLDWEFSGCPAGREYHCWAYEYAREIPDVIEEYWADKAGPRYGFDEEGNWNREIQIFDDNDEFLDSTGLVLPPGFPEVPYQKVHHVVQKTNFDFWFPRLRMLSDEDIAKGKESNLPIFQFTVDWDAPDVRLTKDFRRWLKKQRPRKAKTRTGKSIARRCMKELRALGAYRLLKHMTAPEAIKYTRGLNRTVYAKPSDWYEAKATVKRVLREDFRHVA